MFFLKDLPSRETLERYHDRFPTMQVDAVEKALILMQRGSQLIRRIDDYFARHDFSQLRYLILIVIDREPDREELSVTELAARLDVSKPVMTRTLKGLAEAGFVEISANEHDRRAKRVALTRAGKDKLQAILPGFYETIQDFMSKEDSHG
ncbi:MarR family transcriptional regulator [Pseudodesulfovibrio cashew]|uniref:MarR family transcriptional regulator n=1 Tax=Pseudodesulfovibrio cashew TaxID=2678688 RepID=A0A6I6JEK6_9BACT|nr:MarR family transcriptional regulator [Pseudodesulfovibrio cashew]QGY39043.1 MarR family transcriptional regulator [Pseudodesulfovibrio cashew]